MTKAQFSVGAEFAMADARWRCTDVGTRVIVAIKLNHSDDQSWYNGPPYVVAEIVVDEDDMESCEPA